MVRLLAVLALLSGAVSDGVAQQPDPNLGRNLAAACANCHGTNGASQPGMPSLAGRDRVSLSRALQDFKTGTRPATVMNQIAKGYTDEQIGAIAAYLSLQKAN